MSSNDTDDPRMIELRSWVSAVTGEPDGVLEPASEDASFRRYFRFTAESGSVIVMDAPPAREDSRPFVAVAGYLAAMGINAPRVIEADLEQGFLLLDDLGSIQYLEHVSANPSAAESLYAAAVDALVRMQLNGTAYQRELPPYDEKLLRFELSLFHDWLCGTHLGLAFDAGNERAWCDVADLLVANALEQPRVFVHRDYHSRNLMVVPEANPGVLDFQDAVEGPLTYDLVSLLRDCYIEFTPAEVADRANRFLAGRAAGSGSVLDEVQFWRWFDLTGVQRHLKAAGIFARLNHRDGKPAYLRDIPRTLGYVLQVAPRYPELDWLARWIEERVLPGLGTAP
ncbi:MAG: phosphotransferase [Woeseiaceae bacterium]|nr:phosphotransferase [Woeseiaceae bacterium]